ncbi:MAG: 2-hydroxychromene-2-carboxylate isomerase [Sneathiella sp.]|nr:2-hydroxychromene-2-carboxylate isomerase [Sneathiella sp.]
MNIEFFYAAHSAYAYLGAAELKRIADKAGATIIHRPMDLRTVMPAVGSLSMAKRSQFHMEYFFQREIVRWAEYRNIDVMETIPTHHANDINFANCVLIAADQAGLDINALSEEMLRAHWVDDADIASKIDLKNICQTVNIEADPLFESASKQNVKAAYEANTRDAIDRGVFGSPTYFVADDMFYGQDRLDLVARALVTPFKGRWPIRLAIPPLPAKG